MASLVSSLLTVSYHTAQAVALQKDAEMPDRSEWSFSQKVRTSEVLVWLKLLRSAGISRQRRALWPPFSGSPLS